MVLYNKDFREVYSELVFDYIIIDPPFNIGFKYDKHHDKMSEKDYIDMLSYFKGKKVVVIQYPEETMRYVIPALGIPDKVVSWVYNSNTRRNHRLISFFNCSPDFNKIKQPAKNPNDKRTADMVRSYDWWYCDIVKNITKKKEGLNHPCIMPENIIQKIVLSISNEGDTIFDAFMGSGTTAVVCEKNNRKWIGCEISKDYCDIIYKRLGVTLETPVSPTF